jgi:WD40 repeat protein
MRWVIRTATTVLVIWVTLIGTWPVSRAAPPDQDNGPGWAVLTLENVAQLTEIAAWNQEDGEVWSLAFDPTGGRIASTGALGRAAIWTLDGEIDKRYHYHWGDVLSFAWAPDGRSFAIGGQDGSLWLRPQDADPFMLIDAGNSHIEFSDLAFSPDGRYLAAAAGPYYNAVWVWDMDTQGEEFFRLGKFYSQVTSVAFDPTGEMLATGEADGIVRIFDMETRREMYALSRHTAAVGSVAFNPGPHWVASASLDGTVRLWNPTFGYPGAVMQAGRVWAMVFSQNGRLLFAGDQDGTLWVWDMHGEPLAQIATGAGLIESLASSPDGTLIALGGQDGMIRLWGVPLE